MSLYCQGRLAELRCSGFLPSAFLFLKKEKEGFCCSFISPATTMCLTHVRGGLEVLFGWKLGGEEGGKMIYLEDQELEWRDK